MKYLISMMLFFVSLCGFSAPTPIHQVVVFGDSLSDNGNLYEYMDHQLPMSPPYYAGRFTNGPVWIELLMDKLYPLNGQAHLMNYAFGGAGISLEEKSDDGEFSLSNQIRSYLEANNQTALPDALYVVWIGANNYFNLPDDPDEVVDAVIKGIGMNVETLIHHGAKQVMLLNVPNLAKVPAAIEYEAVDELRYMSLEHNRRLKLLISHLKNTYPDVTFIDYDVTMVMDDLIEHPDQYGFTNVISTCSELMDEPQMKSASSHSLFLSTIRQQGMMRDDQCYGYLFFDLYHPTAHAHEIMADTIYELIQQLKLQFE